MKLSLNTLQYTRLSVGDLKEDLIDLKRRRLALFNAGYWDEIPLINKQIFKLEAGVTALTRFLNKYGG